MNDDHETIDRDFDAAELRTRTLAWVGIFAVLAVALLWWGTTMAAEYTRQGGTADFACCADENCATVITQRMREWSAKDDCEALTDADGVTRYVRQYPMRVYKSGTSPTPTCPPKPADETQTAQCPAGTAGSWTQTQSYGSVPPPQCWVASGFIPSTAPEGACVTTPPPTALPAPTGISATVTPNATNPGNYNVALSWLSVAGASSYMIERCIGATCASDFRAFGPTTNTAYTNSNVPGATTYRYRIMGTSASAGGTWSALRTVTTPTPTTPPPSGTGTARMSWDTPTVNTDGTPATIAGYRFLYSTVGDAGPSLSQVLNLGAVNEHEFTGLSSGRWAFTIIAIDAQGRTSQQSNIAYRDVQ